MGDARVPCVAGKGEGGFIGGLWVVVRGTV